MKIQTWILRRPETIDEMNNIIFNTKNMVDVANS